MKLFLHRKDLRVDDLAAFNYLLSSGGPSLHMLILDPFLLRHSRHEAHSGKQFLRYVRRLMNLYKQYGKTIYVVYGEPEVVLEQVLHNAPIDEVIVHRDFTPYSKTRDRKLREAARARGVPFTEFVDHTLADLADFQISSGKSGPYKVYTPFYKKLNTYLQTFYRPSSPLHLGDLSTVDLAQLEGSQRLLELFQSWVPPFSLEDYFPAENPIESLEDFLTDHLPFYAARRDYYAYDGTSSLSAAINAGAISIRKVYEAVMEQEHSAAWVRQLVWRDFYLYQSIYDENFFSYEKTFDFTNLSDRHFEAWRKAETGVPIIDAAMTELNDTGRMPNRLRMITAMFLTKNLLCPFTLGEQYFRYKLSDYDNTLNRGGWLWCASLGFDASPYFRIMNPVTQSITYDPSGQYLRRWLPQMTGLSDKQIHQPQAHAIVDLKQSRAAAIEVYKHILKSKPTVEFGNSEED
ncbi:DNA photolyase family protein [Paenibacillus sp. HWE-109]|uniref:cryptochrome/photolyase family protein n=1 Tax=Paenibacillus sp. HWE-109 TaxID=1306526 RepID=UPI001EDD92D9|nr:deoxyribodipyrimidine photo-lyase [Paenibacillus sp. HWE-109]UKS25646.1 DNA photolyase family protein [Paenibacillus sp. HWE-109]